jgi:hypothetical protein
MENRHSIVSAAAVFLVFTIFCSCSAVPGLTPQTKAVTFALPPWPPEDNVSYPPVSCWDVSYCAGSLTGTLRLSAQNEGESSFTLELPENVPCAVTAQPVTLHGSTGSAFFRPAGCVYPAGSSITWEGGFPASICAQLYCTSENTPEDTALYLSKFNWAKFSSVLAEKAAADRQEWNPWMLDRSAICSAVADRSFSSVLLTMKNCFSMETGLLTVISPETDTEPLFIPRYVPLYRELRESETIVVKSGALNCYLFTMQQIAVITGSTRDDATLEITAVPLYTGKQ